MKRISSNNIQELKDDEIFVFGSNLAGRHGAGAARLAVTKFEAINGIGFGRCGNTYAIPTKDFHIGTLKLSIIKSFVETFIFYTYNYPNYKFLVTEIGCGLAGYKVHEIAPFFKDALKLKNVYLPQSFVTSLNTYKL